MFVLWCLEMGMEGMLDLFGPKLGSRARISTRQKFRETKVEDFDYTSDILRSFWKTLSLTPSTLAISSAAQVIPVGLPLLSDGNTSSLVPAWGWSCDVLQGLFPFKIRVLYVSQAGLHLGSNAPASA